MQLVLFIKSNRYNRPFSIDTGSAVTCVFYDGLEKTRLLNRKARKKKQKKPQDTIPK